MAEKDLDQSQVLISILQASFAGSGNIVQEAKDRVVPGSRHVPKTFLHATEALKR